MYLVHFVHPVPVPAASQNVQSMNWAPFLEGRRRLGKFSQIMCHTGHKYRVHTDINFIQLIASHKFRVVKPQFYGPTVNASFGLGHAFPGAVAAAGKTEFVRLIPALQFPYIFFVLNIFPGLPVAVKRGIPCPRHSTICTS